MAAPGKQYGLILPKKLLQRPAFLPKHSAFADDSDEETTVGSRLQKEAMKKKVMKQTKLEMQKALQQDATVYEYDSVYDELQKKKEENNAAQMLSTKEKKPKYIQSLLQAVEVRKKEQEKRMEKKIQKEREAEGAEFEDKEAFVTSAYKKKLEERAEEEEQEKREAAIEASLDVTKQKDLSGFYRHLLNQTVGEEQAPECSLRDSRVKEEKPKGYADEPNPVEPTLVEKKEAVKEVIVKKEETPDADVNLGGINNDIELKVESPEDIQELDKKKEGRDSSASDEEDSKGNQGQKQSRSSSEERGTHWVEKHSPKEPKKRHKKEKGEGGSSSKKERQHKERDHEKRDRGDQPEKERHREKGERHRHSSKGESRKRDEAEGRSRTKDKKEKSEKDRKRDKDRDDKHSERERPRNGKEKDRGEKHREREEQSKAEKKERAEKDWKKLDDQKGECPQFARKEGESFSDGEKKQTNESVLEKDLAKEKPPVQEIGMLDDQLSITGGHKVVESEEEGKVSTESSSHLEGLPEMKRKEAEGEEDEALGSRQTEDSAENRNKFAKRSSEETVVSARDRYLARQMARVSTKPYIEKEED
ncbi:nuclear speckle splicing regulatory protein 1 [Ambystoma mexicanum]|uniref:nuclear speckle splicing regulatory protein 1 n=1 Tax=Ambystoma mexicanum TaxID=8296 RepID=UPI0037E76F03